MRLKTNEVLFAWPLAAHTITAGWYYSDGKLHRAIDLSAVVWTPVYAAEDGTVDWVQAWDGHSTSGNQSYGNLVRIRHADYNGGKLQTLYAHLSSVKVKSGQRVSEGELIGYSGNTGNSTGPHLHFEVRLNGARYNPLNWLDGDFDVASDSVRLGSYKSVVRPAETQGEKTEFPIYAIDVSKHQGTINWATVKNAGITHAMIRAGYGRYLKQKDPQFDRNVAQCVALGVDWGVYWYSYATSPAEARTEAHVCLQVIKGLKPTMPVAYDIEYEPGILALSNATRTAMVQAFLQEIEAAGYYGILYASQDFIKNKLNYKELSAYDVWCAQYGSKCTCPMPYGIWQYSSKNPLDIPGFGTSLDCNRVYKDYPAIMRDAGLNGYAPEPEDDGGTDLSVKLQKITIGPISSGDVATLRKLCESLSLTSMGLYSETNGVLTIGPVSSGDAWAIMRQCEALELTDMGLYHSEYVG